MIDKNIVNDIRLRLMEIDELLEDIETTDDGKYVITINISGDE